MLGFFQRTIANEVEVTGVGLHSGLRTHLKLRPAPVNTGIIFIRSDLAAQNPPSIRIKPEVVKNTTMATVIQEGITSISTIEHLMSACCGLAIDNLYVEVSAQEIPIMDGSSAAFVYLLQSAKIVDQTALKKWCRIHKTVEVIEGDKWAKITPYDGFSLDFTIDFDHPALKKSPKSYHFDLGFDRYSQAIAKARTFGFTKEVEALRQAGLARGGHLENVVVLDDYRILNDDLRYRDEFVRHKILDAMGDLYVMGYPILGAYQAHKSGHGLNNQLLHAIIEQKAFTITDFNQEVKPIQDASAIEGWLNQAWVL